MDGITRIADSVSADLKRRLPSQRKTQREKLALLVATMLDVRSANLMDWVAARRRPDGHALPVDHAASRQSPGRQRRDHGAVRARGSGTGVGAAVVLILDQSKFSDRHQVLMLALRFGERAVPLAWRIEATEGASKPRRRSWRRWPRGCPRVRLMGDRFYGTANLIGWCQERTWDYRLRLKGNLTVFDGAKTTAACAEKRTFYLEDVELTARRVRTHIGIIHDPGHPEPWIIAMSERPGYLRTLDYGQRWGIEPMFSDFKSRGFGIPRSASLTAWIASSWSWPSPSTGRSPQDSGMRSTMPLPAKKSVADQPRKVARSRTSWFTRGLRRIVKIVRSCLPLPPLWAARLN